MHRNHALDSLRGLAALAVALGHCVLTVTGQAAWEARLADFPRLDTATILARLAHVTAPSDAAVMLFFALSGHVLWLACARHPGGLLGGLPDWTLARLYRLLPVAMMSALPLGLLAGAGAERLVGNMLLLRYDLNGPAWSLQVEMVASLGLFLVHRAVGGRAGGLAIALALSVLALPLLRGPLPMAVYFPVFLAGALIGAMPPLLWRGPASAPILALGLAALLLGSLLLGHGGLGRAAESLGAVLVVAWVAWRRPAWLLRPALLFLGRISYPFYLSHTLGLALAAPLVSRAGDIGPAAQIGLFALLSLAIALPLAWLLHVAVEAPLMRARPRLPTAPRVEHIAS
ncbi:acyltransferase family protein [Belnapia rosea]|uniref:acyltransferase family protein n=1 Tax=Belnapia rosea TaxID=938405 RepID=UPI00088980AB|nr:acyltransferase family protein [Belnapia rosea]SDB66572.1 Peptidoglycan/LPS O-acetylase OafA/YrhL, contains acyltransferase and SGNH-hydrolase domains [Belnapia rosea]